MASQDSGLPTSEAVYSPVTANGEPSQAMVAAGPYGPPAQAGYGALPHRGPEILHGGFDQSWLLNCLRRRWLSALLFGALVGALSAGVLLWAIPESASVVSLIQVKSEEPTVLETRKSYRSAQEFEIFQQTQLTLMKSQFVLQAALGNPQISQLDAVVKERPNELLWLMDELKVSFPGEGEVMSVSLKGDENPEDMKKLVDAVVASYEDEVLQKDLRERDVTREKLAALHREVSKDLGDKFDEYETLANQLGGAASASAEADIMRLQADLRLIQTELSKAKSEQVEIEVFKQLAIQESKSVSALNAAVQAELDTDPMIEQYMERLYEIDSNIAQIEATSKRKNSPLLKQLHIQRSVAEQNLQQYRLSKEQEIRDRKKAEPNEMISKAMAEYWLRKQAIEDKIADLTQQREDTIELLQQKGTRSPKLQMLLGEIEQLKEIEQSIGFRLQSWSIEAQTAQERVQVVQKALMTENINTVQRYAIAGVGGLAAFCLTCYAVAFVEFGRRRLNGPDQIDEGLGIRVLGALPTVASRKALAPGSAVAAQLAESIDNVRATLMHDSTSRPRQVVMVLSPESMEGSTTVASHLALSLTRAGRRTLLIDGDLREPSLHKLFGMPVGDGLSEVLRSELDVSDAVRPTNTEGLWLLTAGQGDMDAIHALATDQPQPIFEKLRAEFDFIVIDAAPALGLSDSLSLGQYVDGAILTVLRDHSEIRKVHQAAELLTSLGIRLIGSVVNGVNVKADRRVTRLHRATAMKARQLTAEAAG